MVRLGAPVPPARARSHVPPQTGRGAEYQGLRSPASFFLPKIDFLQTPNPSSCLSRAFNGLRDPPPIPARRRRTDRGDSPAPSHPGPEPGASLRVAVVVVRPPLTAIVRGPRKMS